MPGYVVDNKELGPLFPDNDPLTFTVPNPDGGGGVLMFHAADDPILPDDSAYGLNDRPRSALIDHLVSQAVEDEQGDLRKAAVKLMDAGLLREGHIGELFTFLRDEREKARKARLKTITMRPTGAPSLSAPSSTTA